MRKICSVIIVILILIAGCKKGSKAAGEPIPELVIKMLENPIQDAVKIVISEVPAGQGVIFLYTSKNAKLGDYIVERMTQALHNSGTLYYIADTEKLSGYLAQGRSFDEARQ